MNLWVVKALHSCLHLYYLQPPFVFFQLKEGEEAALQEADKDEKPCVGNKMRATRSQCKH